MFPQSRKWYCKLRELEKGAEGARTRNVRNSQVQTPLPDASLESQKWHQRGNPSAARGGESLRSRDRDYVYSFPVPLYFTGTYTIAGENNVGARVRER